jgi:hypothetical protein
MPDQQQYRKALQAEMAIAECDPRYAAAFAALRLLNARGWNLTAFHVGGGVHVENGRPAMGPHLCASGTDNYGDGVTGNFNARGDFSGEPLD